MGEGILEVKKKKPKKRNALAASLRSPKFRNKIVPNKKKEKSNQKIDDLEC